MWQQSISDADILSSSVVSGHVEDVITSSHQDPDVRGSTQFIDALALLKSGFVLNAAEPQIPKD